MVNSDSQYGFSTNVNANSFGNSNAYHAYSDMNTAYNGGNGMNSGYNNVNRNPINSNSGNIPYNSYGIKWQCN